jgi:hypothetical protein
MLWTRFFVAVFNSKLKQAMLRLFTVNKQNKHNKFFTCTRLGDSEYKKKNEYHFLPQAFDIFYLHNK